jgi:hypothetical protein
MSVAGYTTRFPLCPKGFVPKMVSACHPYKIRNETRALLLRLTGKTEVLGNELSVKCTDGHSRYRYTVHQFCLIPVIYTTCMPCTRPQFCLIPVISTACMPCTRPQFCLIPVIYTACMPCQDLNSA